MKPSPALPAESCLQDISKCIMKSFKPSLNSQVSRPPRSSNPVTQVIQLGLVLALTSRFLSGHFLRTPFPCPSQQLQAEDPVLFRETASSEVDLGKLQNAMRTPLVAPKNGQTTVLTGTTAHSPDCDSVLAANGSMELGESLTHRLK